MKNPAEVNAPEPGTDGLTLVLRCPPKTVGACPSNGMERISTVMT